MSLQQQHGAVCRDMGPDFDADSPLTGLPTAEPRLSAFLRHGGNLKSGRLRYKLSVAFYGRQSRSVAGRVRHAE